MIGLILSLLTGIFFILGVFLNNISNNKSRVEIVSVSLAFVVLVNLILFDILPEIVINITSIFTIILGLIILKIIDLFVPHHHHHHLEKNDNKKEHKSHLEHISIMTIIALIIHNIIECVALYNVAQSNIKTGILMTSAIALHNIPLGFSIGSKITNHKTIYNLILTLSGFVGGILAFILGDIPFLVENTILAFTLGMLLYLCLFELLSEVIKYRKNKLTYCGIIIGILVVLLSKFL